MAILVTGGTGYIGSHTVTELLKEGYEVIVIDNLINSAYDVVDRIKKLSKRDFVFYKGDITDESLLFKIFTENNKPILVYETILKTGSLGSILLTYCNEKHILRTFEHIALADHYSKQGSVQEIYDDEKIDLDTVINKCEELMNGKKEN